MKKIINILALAAFGVLFWALPAQGQQFRGFNFPTHLCAGGDNFLTFGFSETDNVQLGIRVVTLNHSETIFLPDGVSCGTMGCAYESPIEFTQFRSSDSVRSVEDIKYLRLNMEHSFIGDLYIKITCPNGQKADIMKYGGTGSSSCLSSIPQSSRGWNAGGTNSTGTDFGISNWSSSGNTCDASTHPAGTGWNYCWSNNTLEGYTYASGGGYVYRSSNHITTSGLDVTVDSSNVAAGTQFYHPDQNFASLVGCPLNGNWSITVQDGWSGDDGYLFEWELALGTEYQGDTCDLVTRGIEGPYVERRSDSLYAVNIPPLAADTTAQYYVYMVNSCGDTIDTTFTVQLHRSYGFNADTVVCNSFHFQNRTYTASQVIDHNFYSDYGCDSILHLNLTVNYSDTSLTTIHQCDPLLWNGVLYRNSGSFTHVTQTHNGCDSVCNLSLIVYGHSTTDVGDSVCDGDLPYAFLDTLFLQGSQSGVYPFHLADRHGCDSTVQLHLVVSHTPSLSLELGNYHCKAEHFTLAATYDLGDITWSAQPTDLSLNDQQGQPSIAIEPYLTTEYTATVVNPGTRCATSRSYVVAPIARIAARMRLTPDFATRSRSQVTLQDLSEGSVNQWLWLANDEVIGTRPQVVYNYPIDEDSVEVTLIVTQTANQCSDTAYGTITLIGGDIWLPNAFTPEAMMNNRFMAKGNNVVEFEMSIYSRNGQRVYYSIDINEGWDGISLSGIPCPQDTYTYRVRYVLMEAPDNPVVLTGNLLLIR